MMNEYCDRRLLGGFRCTDASTGTALPGPFVVSSPGWSIKPNRSGVYAIFAGPNLAAATTQFVPSGSWPAAASFEVTIVDPTQRYLPRRKLLWAPQPLATANTLAPVPLYPSPNAPTAPNWAIVRAAVVNAANVQAGLPWAALQVVRTSDKTPIAVGMADARGEALLIVAGLTWQTSTSGSGPVTETTVAVTIGAYFDPSVLGQTADWIPNPDDLLGNLSNAALKTAAVSGALAPGQTVKATLEISL